jgi:hypothetical protein
MKQVQQITTIFILFLMLANCTKKDNPTPTTAPVIEASDKEVSIAPGENFIIQGTNFSETETYVVKFNEVKAEIVKITSTTLEVAVPENITSGDITLEHNGTVTKVGSFKVLSADIYIFQYDTGVNKLAKVNTATGDLEYVTSSIDYGSNTYGMVYNAAKQEFVGFDETSDFKPFMITIKKDGTASEKVFLKGKSFEDPVIDEEGNVYIFHDDADVKKLAKVNTTTGDLEYITASIDYGTNTRGLVYNAAKQEFVGFDYTQDFKPFMMTIKKDGTTSEKIFLKGTNFDDPVIDEEGNVYIFHSDEGVKKFAKVDTSTGALEYLGSGIDYGANTRGIVYNPAKKEFVGFDYTQDFKLFMITIKKDGTASDKVFIKDSFIATGGNFTDPVVAVE